MNYHAFISYKHDSHAKKLARELYDVLNKQGYRIWFDEVSIKPGDKWHDAIKNALNRSSVVFFVFDHSDYNKGMIKSELDAALNKNKRVVPVVKNKSLLSKLPKELADRQAIVFSSVSDMPTNNIQKLFKEIDGSISAWSRVRSYLINDS